MKLATFIHNSTIHYGTVNQDSVTPVSPEFQAKYPSLRLVFAADALDQLNADVAHRAPELTLDAVQLLPPIHDPERVYAAGLNYPKYYPLDNTWVPKPENPVLFAKLPGTLVGHAQALELPRGDAANTFDYEGEIVAVIGKAGRYIAVEDAYAYVAGYTAMNEGSVRAWQKHSVHAGKNFANSGSCGPWLVTADEIADPTAITLQTRLNGELVQSTTAREMFYSIAELISYISHTIDLRPGDLIATGSPEGSGGSRTPKRFLRAGDVVEVAVGGVGTLRNRVTAE